MNETNRIEFKRELSESLERVVVAFLNNHDGGVIYIGVDDDAQTVGVDDCDAVQLRIKDRLKNNIRPSCLGLFDVLCEGREGKNILKIIVASGAEKPYHLRKYGLSGKGCFMRVGSSCEPMPARIIEELFAQRTRNSISRMRSPRQDLSFEQLRIYYQEAGLALNDKFAASLELLTDDGAYNMAAYLLADENGNSVQVARYAGTDRVDLIESKDYGFCCLVKTCKSVLDRVEGVENRVMNKITSRERIDRPFWNSVALREAIINAIIHNDYSTELVPKFELFSDRIEITSAGSIHPGQEQVDFFAGYSNPRNKTVMRVFRDLEMVEYLGSGMPRILKAYPRESFVFSGRFIRTVFPMNLDAVTMAKEEKETSGKASGKASGKTSGKIIELMRENVDVSIPEIAKKLQRTPRAIEMQINQMKASGSLRRIGSAKGGHWEVLEP